LDLEGLAREMREDEGWIREKEEEREKERKR